MNRVKVLCVDDEPQVLEGLALNLRRTYEVKVATSGLAGLEILSAQGPFAVVLSDMRMPVMDGAAFLGLVREADPDTIRMLLTGHADLQSAIMAVNEGQIFRFLTKPCPPDQLRSAFNAATEQHHLVTAERVLLEQTLRGSIKTLTDILSMTNPVAFGRATRIKRHVSELADALNLENRWQVEVAAMLSQLGSISLPEETAERFYKSEELSDREKEMVARMPKVTEDLLANIPRLEPVREILAKQGIPFEAKKGKASHPIGARILKIVAEFDELETRGISIQLALDTMLGRESRYDPKILQEFVRLKGASAAHGMIREIPLKSVREGMIFTEDVRTKTGLLLVARGFEVTQSFLEKVRNFQDGMVNEPLRVIVKNQ